MKEAILSVLKQRLEYETKERERLELLTSTSEFYANALTEAIERVNQLKRMIEKYEQQKSN